MQFRTGILMQTDILCHINFFWIEWWETGRWVYCIIKSQFREALCEMLPTLPLVLGIQKIQKENWTWQVPCASHFNSLLCHGISSILFLKISNQNRHQIYLVTYSLWLPNYMNSKLDKLAFKSSSNYLGSWSSWRHD